MYPTYYYSTPFQYAIPFHSTIPFHRIQTPVSSVSVSEMRAREFAQANDEAAVGSWKFVSKSKVLTALSWTVADAATA